MKIGKKIKERRLELGLTMREVAEKSGVSEATVSRWESGDIANMRRNKIVQLANALQVSPSFIMGWEEKQDIPDDLTFSLQVRELRKKKNVNMVQVANDLNMPYTTYVNYERGFREPNFKTLIKFSNYFNTTVDYLLGLSNTPQPMKTEQDEGHALYDKLDNEDKAEIRGEMKQMLKADKYN